MSEVEGNKNKAPQRLGTFATETSEESGGRDRWGGRLAFYLAAVGSAVGFGNVWRFPALAKDYGGGAFFLPYVLAFLLVGLPVLLFGWLGHRSLGLRLEHTQSVFEA